MISQWAYGGVNGCLNLDTTLFDGSVSNFQVRPGMAQRIYSKIFGAIYIVTVARQPLLCIEIGENVIFRLF
jgi:hypothetical protein